MTTITTTTTFNPIFPYYVKMANSQSYIQPSSSLGPTAVATLASNLEWNYHHINSQTRINYQQHINNSAHIEKQISYTTSTETLLHSFGPFRINLDKKGNPEPMFIAMVPGLQVVNPTDYITGSYTIHLRTSTATGNKSILELGTLISTSQTQGTQLNTSWYTLTTPSASYISSSMSSSSSVIMTTNNPIAQTKLLTRTSKSLDLPDSSQTVCLAYLDIYFKITSYIGTPSLNASINGLYAREINIKG